MYYAESIVVEMESYIRSLENQVDLIRYFREEQRSVEETRVLIRRILGNFPVVEEDFLVERLFRRYNRRDGRRRRRAIRSSYSGEVIALDPAGTARTAMDRREISLEEIREDPYMNEVWVQAVRRELAGLHRVGEVGRRTRNNEEMEPEEEEEPESSGEEPEESPELED